MINWNFIGTLEGRVLQGYVPDVDHSNSGVTIATGVDLGSMSMNEFAKFSFDIQVILKPYLGYHGASAQLKLRQSPLYVTSQQADIIDQTVQADSVHDLKNMYNATSKILFDAIPDRAQTVVASVHFQYGDLPHRTPNFWGSVVTQKWRNTVDILNNFGDAYHTRHKKEADYLGLIFNQGVR